MGKTIPERIQAMIEYYGLNPQRFAARIGAKTKQSIYNLLYGQTRTLSEAMQDKICVAFPEVNRDWLMTGNGKMLITNVDDSPPPDVSQVPLIPFGASAGSFSSFGAESVMLRDCERVTAPVGGCDIAIDVYGDSMEPEYPSGCRVFAQRITPDAFIPWGNVFLLDTSNGAYLKRVYPSENKGAVLAKSDNAKYPPFDIPKTAILGMYRVIVMLKSYATN